MGQCACKYHEIHDDAYPNTLCTALIDSMQVQRSQFKSSEPEADYSQLSFLLDLTYEFSVGEMNTLVKYLDD